MSPARSSTAARHPARTDFARSSGVSPPSPYSTATGMYAIQFSHVYDTGRKIDLEALESAPAPALVRAGQSDVDLDRAPAPPGPAPTRCHDRRRGFARACGHRPDLRDRRDQPLLHPGGPGRAAIRVPLGLALVLGAAGPRPGLPRPGDPPRRRGGRALGRNPRGPAPQLPLVRGRRPGRARLGRSPSHRARAAGGPGRGDRVRGRPGVRAPILRPGPDPADAAHVQRHRGSRPVSAAFAAGGSTAAS